MGLIWRLIWSSQPNGLVADFAELRRFYRAAADNGEAVLLAIT